MFELEFQSGARAGVVIPVTKTLVAGRDSECSLEIPDPRVSRLHARLDWDGVHCTLTDTNSSNGTFVNEEPITTRQLEDGDVVRFGSTRLRVRHRDPRSASGVWDRRTQVFGFRDAKEPRTSLSVSMSRLEEAAAQRDAGVLRRRLAAMLKVSEVLASTRSVGELYEPVLDALFELLPQTDRGFLMLGEGSDSLEPCAMRDRERSAATQLVVSRSICRAALEKRAALLYREGGDEPIEAGHSVIDLRIRSAIAAPLIVGDDVLGMVVVDTKNASRAYRQDDVELAAAIAQQVAIAVKNAQLLREVEEQTATRNNLMRFLPEAQANQVLAGELDLGLGGRRYRGTVLFSDIIGFTARSESMPPERVVAFMNRYFDRLVPCIEREAGSIDKFMGDAIMAVWGIPEDGGLPARRAATAALHMQVLLAAFNSEAEHPLPMGVGLNTGDMVAGNIGAGNRLEYTVIGDAVNTAQRVGTTACHEQVLISQSTWDELGGRGFGVRMPELLVKNRVEPVNTISLRGIALEQDEVLLFVPVSVGGGRGALIRRMADGSFLLLHGDGPIEPLGLQLVEIPATDLGAPELLATLPRESDDGALRRSSIRLADPTLGGLLGGTVTSCGQSWSSMSRADTALDF